METLVAVVVSLALVVAGRAGLTRILQRVFPWHRPLAPSTIRSRRAERAVAWMKRKRFEYWLPLALGLLVLTHLSARALELGETWTTTLYPGGNALLAIGITLGLLLVPEILYRATLVLQRPPQPEFDEALSDQLGYCRASWAPWSALLRGTLALALVSLHSQFFLGFDGERVVFRRPLGERLLHSMGDVEEILYFPASGTYRVEGDRIWVRARTYRLHFAWSGEVWSSRGLLSPFHPPHVRTVMRRLCRVSGVKIRRMKKSTDP